MFTWQMQVPDLALPTPVSDPGALGSRDVEGAGVAACKPGHALRKCVAALVRGVWAICRYWMRNLFSTAGHSVGLPPMVSVKLERQCCLVNCTWCRH